jgi:hypothetical protein
MRFLSKTFNGSFESIDFLSEGVIRFVKLYRHIGYGLYIIHQFHGVCVVHYHIGYLQLAKLEHT